MRRFGKTFEEGARRGILAGLYALIMFTDSFGATVCCLRKWETLDENWCRVLSILRPP
jgi:hypothetical protein